MQDLFQAVRAILTVLFVGFILNYPTALARIYVDSKKDFQQKIQRPVKTYVVFGAEWCAPCKKLKQLLKDANIAHKIVFLDASKIWVAKILLDLHYQMIPYTAVYQNAKHTGVIRVGMNESLIFLLANVDPN